jgi:hypothetical protein
MGFEYVVGHGGSFRFRTTIMAELEETADFLRIARLASG